MRMIKAAGQQAARAAAVGVFVLLICTPALMHLYSGSARVLGGEKRFASQLPSLPRRPAAWKPFVSEVDGYLRDNFGLRGWLLTQYHWLRYHWIGDYHTGSAQVLIGRDGWLFYDMYRQIDAGRGRWEMTQPELRYWAE